MCVLSDSGAVVSRFRRPGAAVHSERAIEYARSLNHAHTLQFALAYGGAYFAANCRDAGLSAIDDRGIAGDRQGACVAGVERGRQRVAWQAPDRARTDERGHCQIAGRYRGIQARRFARSGSPRSVPGLPRLMRHAARSRRGSPRWRWAGRLRPAGHTGWMRNCIARRANFGRSEGWPIMPARKRSFIEALAVARSQSSRMLELRAAMSLARLWQSQERDDRGACLAPACHGVVHRGA